MDRRSLTVVLATAVSWLAAAAPAAAQVPSPTAQAPSLAEHGLDSLATAELRGTVMTGAVVGFLAGGYAMLRSYGRERYGADGPLPLDGLFRAAGATELLNGLLAARLAAEGRVDLHASIGSYVPGLPRALQPITLDQLLSHTGGLAAVPVVPGRGGDDDLGHAARQLTFLDRFTEPGSVYSYSASGVSLAGYALERAGGRPWAELVRALVLEPLGMSRSAIGLDAAATLGLVPGHALSESAHAPLFVVAPQPDSVAALPRRGLYAAPVDLARLAAALLADGAVEGEASLPAGVVAEVLRPRARIPGAEGATAGLGVRVGRWEGRPEIRLSSGGSGFGMLLRVLTEDGLAVFVQSNTNGTVFLRTPELLLRRTLGLAEPPRGVVPDPPLHPLPDSVAASLAGSYTNGGEKITLVVQDGALRLDSGGLLLDVRAAEDGRFAATIPDGRVALWFVWDSDEAGRRFLFVDGRALMLETG